MTAWQTTLNTFILQAKAGGLKTSNYPKEFSDLRFRVSFGMGAPSRIPWVAFLAPEMNVSSGYYPVYLYYKDLNILILAYGVSETYKFAFSWPLEISSSKQTISAYLEKKVARYGDSFVFKAYKVDISGKKVGYKYLDSNTEASDIDIEADLTNIIEYYKKSLSVPFNPVTIESSSGLFYMEKQLEDFIVHNWESIDLGKKYNLIIEEGELMSQQYKTEIGPIDILARDKKTNDYVVIELKKDQTSDDTIGQLTRYMGWVKQKWGREVKGVIIAGNYDRRLDLAHTMVPGVEIFIYEVDFKLKKFIK